MPKTIAEMLAKDPWGKPQAESGSPVADALAGAWDEAKGAFARYGRRSAAQRDASLALLNNAVDPNTDPLTGAAQKVLGITGLVTHPLAFFPTREEWDQRLAAAGNGGRVSRSIGGVLSDLPSLIDPQMAAGGAALAAAPIVGKLGRGMADLAGDATDAELAALRARLGAEADQVGGAANQTTRDEALQNLVGEQPQEQWATASCSQVLPDGSTQRLPGTLRANPTTAPRFEPTMSLAEIRRYVEQYGEPPPPRAKGELITGKRKDHYPDGTVKPVPGLLRTKRPPRGPLG